MIKTLDTTLKNTSLITKPIQLLLVVVMLIFNFTTIQAQQNKEESLVGIWVNKKAQFNGQDSPVPKNFTLNITSNNRIKITLPKFGDNYEDIIGFGSWERKDGIVKIDYDDENMWGGTQIWEIVKLTDKKLEWKMKISGGLQEEIYTRKE